MNTVRFLAMFACLLGVIGCHTTQPTLQIQFLPEGEESDWRKTHNEAVSVISAVEDSSFAGSFLRVRSSDDQGRPISGRPGALLLADDKEYINPLLRVAEDNQRFHGLEGAIAFLARPTLLNPTSPGAFAPFDWKFSIRTNRRDHRLRLVFQTRAHGPGPAPGPRLEMSIASPGTNAIQLSNRQYVPKLSTRSTETFLMNSNTIYQMAITFKQDSEGWTTMKAFAQANSGTISTRSKPLISQRFRIDACRIDWSEPLVANNQVFGIMSPDPRALSQADYDELRFYNNVPRKIRAPRK